MRLPSYCIKCEWLLDCLVRKVAKVVGHSPSISSHQSGLSDSVRHSGMHSFEASIKQEVTMDRTFFLLSPYYSFLLLSMKKRYGILHKILPAAINIKQRSAVWLENAALWFWGLPREVRAHCYPSPVPMSVPCVLCQPQQAPVLGSHPMPRVFANSPMCICSVWFKRRRQFSTICPCPVLTHRGKVSAG